ncbi:TetR/AcrR family transcriptional regulator [Tardiphaga sp.]|jgi:AcrR family transcriptional regulator|uniref:TetR/AcrR family transcriptional regulator n=1 Tax=Tardiphaga sp. TaxID=1926292 RepID=UPI0037DA4707
MTTLRMTHDLRRELILSAAKRCFAHNGFAGTTTKSVAAAASISEGLLFKHFPTKSALYAEILAEECKADPALNRLLDLPASTETLVILIREMVRHFLEIARQQDDDDEEAQRLRLVTISYLNDGEFARLMHEKIAGIIGSAFVAAYEQAVKTGDARASSQAPMNLFWFAHHAAMTTSLSLLPTVPSLSYGKAESLDLQLTEFILRGIGLNDDAIASHIHRALPPELMPAHATTTESA